eukprot:m.24219 g.24219  ORF g.24219 m.24219 type:complete len:413 (+) comp14504_c0_seq1:176-1414(+)
MESTTQVPGGDLLGGFDDQSFWDESFWNIIYAILEFCTDLVLQVPVTFRASGVLLLFMFGWGLNIIGFETVKLPWRTVLGLRSVDGQPIDIFTGVGLMSGLLIIHYSIYRACRRAQLPAGEAASQVTFWITLFLLFYFSSRTIFKESRVFLYNRVNNFITAGEVKFIDVLFADALTSVSKLLADSQMIMCSVSFVFFGEYFYNACSGSLVGPILASIPYAIRAFQCWLTYSSKGDQMQLLNLGKYMSSFPVIWTSALKRDINPANGFELDKHEEYLQALWMYTVVINTVYSWLWDVYMDWGLGRPRMGGKPQWPFLRSTLVYQYPLLYYLIVPFDLALRATWSLKLSSHLLAHASGPAFVFVFEILEVLRRWGWIYFRVEWECINKKILVPNQDAKVDSEIYPEEDLRNDSK